MFWDDLMEEMGVGAGVATSGWYTPTEMVYELIPEGSARVDPLYGVGSYNVGDVIVGEIVEETAELTTGEKAVSL